MSESADQTTANPQNHPEEGQDGSAQSVQTVADERAATASAVHDPMCPGSTINLDATNCWRCLFLAQVRADEREQAAQRVAGAWHWALLNNHQQPARSVVMAAIQGEA